MIAPLFVALQIARGDDDRSSSASPIASCRFRIVASSRRADGAARSRLAEMLPIEVRRESASSYVLEIWGVRLRLEPGVAVVRVGDEVRPLASAPRVQNGHLLIPLQLVSEVFPTVVPNTRWDAEQSQLVLFTSLPAAGARPAASSRGSARDAVAPRSSSGRRSERPRRARATAGCRRCRSSTTGARSSSTPGTAASTTA